MASRAFRLALACLLAVAVSGCGVAALPCRVTSAAIKVVPVVGHPVAAPFDACADAID
jgi:hypothetical protein